jgi:pyruvate/2-oxoglutarate/acetoin dehydrogenase E1 component
MGQDIAEYGGAFKVTGFVAEFGKIVFIIHACIRKVCVLECS